MQNIARKSVILDTSVLIVLYHFDLLKYLNLFYSTARVPREVEREFLRNHPDGKERTKRYNFLADFYMQNASWFIPCNEYGSDIVELYLTEKGIDKGEAEAFAQNQALGSVSEILLDERNARKLAKNKKIKHHGVLYILANLEVKFQLCNYLETVKIASEELGTFFSEKIIKEVYNHILNNSV